MDPVRSEKKFLFSKVNLKNKEDAVNLTFRARSMQKSTNHILDRIKSLSRGNEVKTACETVNKAGIIKRKKRKKFTLGTFKFLQFRNNPKFGTIFSRANASEKVDKSNKEKTKENNLLAVKIFENKKIKDKSDNKNLIKHSVDFLKKQRVIKRLGTSREGFLESLFMKNQKEFDVYKFLNVNMFSTLGSKTPRDDEVHSSRKRNKDDILTHTEPHETVINIEIKEDGEILDHDHLNTQLDEKKNKPLRLNSNHFPSSHELKSLSPTRANTSQATRMNTPSWVNNMKTINTSSSIKSPVGHQILSPFKQSANSRNKNSLTEYNTVNTFYSQKSQVSNTFTNKIKNQKVDFPNQIFRSFDNVKTNLEEIKENFTNQSNYNNMKYLNLKQISDPQEEFLESDRKKAKHQDHSNIVPFLRNTDRFKKINSDTVYKFRYVIKDENRKQGSLLLQNNNKEKPSLITFTGMDNKLKGSDEKACKCLNVLTNNNLRLKQMDYKLTNKKKSIYDNIQRLSSYCNTENN